MNQQPILLYSVADVRAMDAVAINEIGIDSYLLMTRAGEASLKLLSDRSPTARSLLVICGAGNNAGDGYVMARLARERDYQVTVSSVIDPDILRGDAQRAHREFLEGGGQCTEFDAVNGRDFDVTVDALLGTGLARPVTGQIAAAIARINTESDFVLSLDIPSGLDGDSGHASPVAVLAHNTITFVGLKTGLYTGSGPAHTGQVWFDSLGVPDQLYDRFTPAARLLSGADVAQALPQRPADAHKTQFGRVLVVAGGVGMPGAALLAGTAALRAGAGLVKIACHPGNESIVAARPELMCDPLADATMLEPLLEWCDVIAVGPGLGRDTWAESMVKRCFSAGKPMVVDADALFFLSLSGPRPEHLIVTPHVGEAARLLDCETTAIQQNRFAACRQIASAYCGVCILKGAGTVVAGEKSALYVCDKGNPGMATAGTGDVLTGVVAGILAQQPDKPDLLVAARAAVWVHAMAGDRASDHGERGLLAGDLLEYLRAFVN